MSKAKIQQVGIVLLSLLTVAALVAVALTRCETESSSPLTTQDSIPAQERMEMPQLIHRVQQCSRLYSTEYKVRKIVTHEDQKVLKLGGMKVNIPMTDRHIAIPLDATLKAYVDMSSFSERNVATDGERIVVTLPDPKIEVTSTLVDHDKTQEHVSWIRQDYTVQEQEQLHRQGLMSIAENALQTGILEDARASVARTLVPMLQQMGYQDTQIEIRFGKPEFSLKDLPALLDSKEIKF